MLIIYAASNLCINICNFYKLRHQNVNTNTQQQNITVKRFCIQKALILRLGMKLILTFIHKLADASVYYSCHFFFLYSRRLNFILRTQFRVYCFISVTCTTSYSFCLLIMRFLVNCVFTELIVCMPQLFNTTPVGMNFIRQTTNSLYVCV